MTGRIAKKVSFQDAKAYLLPFKRHLFTLQKDAFYNTLTYKPLRSMTQTMRKTAEAGPHGLAKKRVRKTENVGKK